MREYRHRRNGGRVIFTRKIEIESGYWLRRRKREREKETDR